MNTFVKIAVLATVCYVAQVHAAEAEAESSGLTCKWGVGGASGTKTCSDGQSCMSSSTGKGKGKSLP